jgi:hypothetical protein
VECVTKDQVVTRGNVLTPPGARDSRVSVGSEGNGIRRKDWSLPLLKRGYTRFVSFYERICDGDRFAVSRLLIVSGKTGLPATATKHGL